MKSNWSQPDKERSTERVGGGKAGGKRSRQKNKIKPHPSTCKGRERQAHLEVTVVLFDHEGQLRGDAERIFEMI